MSHAYHDRVSLEMARRIAAGLPEHPEWLDFAKANIARWKRLNADAPGLIRCYDEWAALLERPLEEIRTILVMQNDEGQRLRQNSPFAGVLSPQEVWDIKRRMRHEEAAT